MPSTTVSNKALEDATARVQQLVAQAMQLKNGPAGHFTMAMEIAKNLPVFEQHGRSASMISPLLLSAAMELQSHLDPGDSPILYKYPHMGQHIMDDRRIEKHPLYPEGSQVYCFLKPIAIVPPSGTNRAEAVIDNATEDPPVASKPKPKPIVSVKNTEGSWIVLKVMASKSLTM
ncbi:uncharacterized protein F5891DRAFT_1180526 [Suillus fuscotomentosus]|uniref:Uncharacterized protein n=1 Tax=Suillus fuscotomentosus TaxID=1912939 RepID=A0AAD4HUP3_9AGAM|nr:uncharacterized protein F5891DRAFT_1180526 [Suillus fuscotomentosus]KAG1908952.1 hypothetical protein F5891DRAFT_1180526 [Suillus fuscotomentosus]